MTDLIQTRFDESVQTVRSAGGHLSGRIAQAAGLMIDCLKGGGEIFLFGNGGSAADAQHIAGELVGHFLTDRRPLKAQALSTDTSILTCIGNDYDFKDIFSRQIQGKGRAGDVAVGLSTSGNSANIVAALAMARKLGLKTIALTGPGGGKCTELADVLLDVPAPATTPRVQEAHCVIYHILCELVEAAFV